MPGKMRARRARERSVPRCTRVHPAIGSGPGGSGAHRAEFLVLQLMQRGMIVEVDHLPARAYERAFELAAQHDCPLNGSHGRTRR